MSFDHNKLIIDQFTKQAIPFTKKAARYIEETFEKILSVVNVDDTDVILDVSLWLGLDFNRVRKNI